MKELYQLLVAALKTVPEIKWIDFDYGQFDRKDPALKYPCTLIRFESTNKDIDESGSQEKSYTLTLRTAFDATGSRTAADTPDSVLNRSLAYTEVASDVYDAFQAVALGDYTEFECVSEGQEQRSDGLVVFKQVFKTDKMVFK